jgi:hypothetical protein
MGWCQEFGPRLVSSCEHPMEPWADRCRCPSCGTVCTGRFAGCAAVWAAAPAREEVVAGTAGARGDGDPARARLDAPLDPNAPAAFPPSAVCTTVASSLAPEGPGVEPAPPGPPSLPHELAGAASGEHHEAPARRPGPGTLVGPELDELREELRLAVEALRRHEEVVARAADELALRLRAELREAADRTQLPPAPLPGGVAIAEALAQALEPALERLRADLQAAVPDGLAEILERAQRRAASAQGRLVRELRATTSALASAAAAFAERDGDGGLDEVRAELVRLTAEVAALRRRLPVQAPSRGA